MAARPARTFILIVMDIIFVIAVLDVVRLVVEFFAALAGQEWAKSFLRMTRVLVLPIGVKNIATPYGGVFDISVAVTILLLLAVEWGLGIARRSA
jgi:hypothetical protein